jgi:hypothetical protein
MAKLPGIFAVQLKSLNKEKRGLYKTGLPGSGYF